jgi:peroxiredoxin
MRNWQTQWMSWLAALLVATYLGCRGGTGSEGTEPSGGQGHGQTASSNTSAKAKASAVQKSRVEEPVTIPEVLLLEAEQQTCLVNVGDVMPDAQLPDLTGKVQSLRGLAGEKLTVVFFWTAGSSEYSPIRARQALLDLQKDVFEPYHEKGVQVIGVNEADTAEVAGRIIGEAKITFPSLLDSEGALFAKVATEGLPRPYLLDAEGKILWLGLEFSQTSLKKLTQGIRVALGETGN